MRGLNTYKNFNEIEGPGFERVKGSDGGGSAFMRPEEMVKARVCSSQHEFRIDCNVYGPEDGYYLTEFLLDIHNCGDGQHTFKNIVLRVIGIESGKALCYWEGYEPRLSFPKKVLYDISVIPKWYNYFFVEPGVEQVLSYVAMILDSINGQHKICAGSLNAWIDFNDDGDWADANEQIFKDDSLVPGSNTLTFNVPSNAATGYTYARFRFDTKGGLSFDGSADDGEVEDYAIKITPIQPLTPVESKPDVNFESIEIGSNLARAMNGGSKLHTLAINNLEIKKNQDSCECGCCPDCSNYHTKYTKEMITIGNRDSMAIGFASATNNIKVLTNQQ